MAQFTSSPIAMLFVSVALGSIGQILLKLGVGHAHHSPEVGSAAVLAAVRSLANPLVLGGFLLYGLSSIIWLMIIKRIPLSTAYPMISMSYIVVVVLSALILREPVRWTTTIPALLLICGGVSLIGMGMGGK